MEVDGDGEPANPQDADGATPAGNRGRRPISDSRIGKEIKR